MTYTRTVYWYLRWYVEMINTVGVSVGIWIITNYLSPPYHHVPCTSNDKEWRQAHVHCHHVQWLHMAVWYDTVDNDRHLRFKVVAITCWYCLHGYVIGACVRKLTLLPEPYLSKLYSLSTWYVCIFGLSGAVTGLFLLRPFRYVFLRCIRFCCLRGHDLHCLYYLDLF